MSTIRYTRIKGKKTVIFAEKNTNITKLIQALRIVGENIK